MSMSQSLAGQPVARHSTTASDIRKCKQVCLPATKRLPVVAKESRIGKVPVPVPAGIDVKIEGQSISIKGTKGQLSRVFPDEIIVTQEDGQLLVKKAVDTRKAKQLHGLCRTLTNNMVVGCSVGFEKKLKLVGVGYRASMQGNDINLNLGYSHPVVLTPPDGVSITVEGNVNITVSGYDKEQVGNFAAIIRAKRPPEPYKGKGVRYADERVVMREAKKGK